MSQTLNFKSEKVNHVIAVIGMVECTTYGRALE